MAATRAMPASGAQYSAPRYYEIAFDMNRKQEVDFLDHCFRTYSKRPVRSVLDIACGTGPHLIRLARRGYRMTGLDLSPANIAFLGERVAAQGLQASLVVGDMTRIRLPRPVDAAICMQDSQGHLLTNEAIIRHLRSVARAVRPGGLYVFDRYMCSSWVDPARRWSWTRRRGAATVRATFETLKGLDPVTQVFFEHMEFEVVDNGARHVYRQRHASRMVFPQELRSLVELAGKFALVEWFHGFQPHLTLDRAHHPLLMVVVLRRV
jgi:SAM-dependent methyltransferase